MTIVIKRRENESNERLIRRFTRRIQTSGLLLRAKKRQYFEKDKNHSQAKKDALRRLKLIEKSEYLKKTQIFDEETEGKRRYSRTK